MESISRVSCRSFQFFTGRGKGGFGAFSLCAILFRIQLQLLDRHCEPCRDEMARYESAKQKQRACPANSPAEPMQLSHRISEWINADFVRRWEERIRIESFVKQELRSTVYSDGKVALRRSRIRDRFCDFTAQGRLRRF